MTGASWTDERTELLRKLWTDGLSASQIAGEMGGLTRNAVIGKVHRLGLSGRGQPTSSIKRQRRAPQRRTYARGVFRTARASNSRAVGVAETEPCAIRLSVVVPIALDLSLSQLTDRTCKWPIGDPRVAGFGFCGHEALGGLPYCEYHCGVAYKAEPPNKPHANLFTAPRGASGPHIVFDAARSGAWR